MMENEVLFNLSDKYGTITIRVDFFLELTINGGKSLVLIDYDADPIARFPFSPDGVQNGLDFLETVSEKSRDEMIQMVLDYRVKMYGN